MNYALVENGIVANIIWLNPRSAADFPGAVVLGDRPVSIGDSYADGVFSRSGAAVLTPLEVAEASIAELDVALLESEYNAIIEGGI